MTEKKKDWIMRILVILWMLLVCGGLLYLYFHFGKELVEFIKDTDRLTEWVKGYGFWSPFIFVAIRIVQTVVKFIPTEPMELGAGLVWGWFGGLVLCLLGNILGSVIILFLTRKFGVKILHLFRLDKKMESMRFLQDREKRNRLLFIFYLIPGTPKDTMTYFVGCTDASFVEFLILSSIARIPAIVSSTICGDLWGVGGKDHKIAAAIVFIVTALLSIPGAIIYKKISARYMQNHTQTDAGSETEQEAEQLPESEQETEQETEPEPEPEPEQESEPETEPENE